MVVCCSLRKNPSQCLFIINALVGGGTQRKQSTTFPISDTLGESLEVYYWEQNKQTELDYGISDKAIQNLKNILIVDQVRTTGVPMAVMLETLGFKARFLKPDKNTPLLNTENNCQLMITSVAFFGKNQLEPLLKEHPDLDVIFYGGTEEIEQIISHTKKNPKWHFIKIPHDNKELVELLF